MSKFNTTYHFGDSYIFNEREHLLTRNGEVVPLGPLASELLLLFLKNSNRLLRHQQIKSIWPAGKEVQEKTIRVHITRLQSRLRIDEENYFEAEPKKGYRFLHEVEMVQSKDAAKGTSDHQFHYNMERSLMSPHMLSQIKSTIEEAVGPYWQNTKGFAHPDLQKLYEVSLAIANNLNLDPLVSLKGIWLTNLLAAKYDVALAVANEIADHSYTEVDEAVASAYIGATLYYHGRYDDAIQHYENPRIIDLWKKYPQAGEWVGQLSHAVLVYLSAGKWNDSDNVLRLCLELASASYPLVTWHAMLFDLHATAAKHQIEATIDKANSLIAICEDNHFYTGFAKVYLGWAKSFQSDAEAHQILTEGKAQLYSNHTENSTSHVLSLEAEALGNAGTPNPGLELCVTALRFSDNRNELHVRAEILRRHAKLLDMAGDSVEAEKKLVEAVRIASSQKARFFKLNAASALAEMRPSEANLSQLSQVVDSWPDGPESEALENANRILGR